MKVITEGLEDGQRIHMTDDGRYVIAWHAWMPGIYENEEAARLAFVLGDDRVLREAQRAVNAEYEDDAERYIRLETMKALVTR